MSASSSTNHTITEYLFTHPELPCDTTLAVRIAMGAAALSERLATENRTRVEHVGGRPENVLEHTGMLVKVVVPLVAELYPDIDVGLAAQFASVHDDVEAYVGDTATDHITTDGLILKKKRESQGLEQLVKEFAHTPYYVQLIERYEAQLEPAARVVRVIDKLMPLLHHLATDGHVLKSKCTRESLLENSAAKATELRMEYPDFEEIIQLRELLAMTAVEQFDLK